MFFHTTVLDRDLALIKGNVKRFSTVVWHDADVVIPRMSAGLLTEIAGDDCSRPLIVASHRYRVRRIHI